MRSILLALALLAAVPPQTADVPSSEGPGPICFPLIGCIKA
ncbi:hypothetical protein [Rubrivirga sp. IMCC43871]